MAYEEEYGYFCLSFQANSQSKRSLKFSVISEDITSLGVVYIEQFTKLNESLFY